tara:strand:+ start:118 stop:237 length:120 start_codon:yes stop_codon:yes gene_type:complete
MLNRIKTAKDIQTKFKLFIGKKLNDKDAEVILKILNKYR